MSENKMTPTIDRIEKTKGMNCVVIYIDEWEQLKSEVSALEAERDALHKDNEYVFGYFKRIVGLFPEAAIHSTMNNQLEAVEKSVSAMQAENERLKAELADHENREAAVCPEDWAFDDYIKHLESKLTAAKAELIAYQRAAFPISSVGDELSDLTPQRLSDYLHAAQEAENELMRMCNERTDTIAELRRQLAEYGYCWCPCPIRENGTTAAKKCLSCGKLLRG